MLGASTMCCGNLKHEELKLCAFLTYNLNLFD